MEGNTVCIQNAIDYVEEHLDDIDLHLETVASYAGYSPSRFSKLFHFLVGETFQAYVRDRRLTRCAEELLESDRRIIDIATSWGFSSQSTFTRAFGSLFGTTPATYRKNGIHLFVEKPNLAKRFGGIKTVSAPPRFEHVEPFDVVGMRFLWTVETGYNVAEWWDMFLPRIHEIEGADTSMFYGICETPSAADFTLQGSIRYLAGVRVPHVSRPLPAGMVKKTICGGNYAAFTDTEGLDSLLDTCRYIWGTWVPHSGIVPLETENFDLYPPELFSDTTKVLPIEVWYPIGSIPKDTPSR